MKVIGLLFLYIFITRTSAAVVGDQCSSNRDCTMTISNSECDTNGSGTCVCSKGHTKSSDNTQCDIVDCGNPQDPAYYFGNPTVTTYLGTVEVTGCSIGHEGVPTKYNITCQASGHWEDNTGCTIKECPPLRIDHGILDTSSVTYDTVVSITCTASYKLRGSSSLFCQSDESWSPMQPTCVQVTNPVFYNPPDSAGADIQIAEDTAVETSIYTAKASDGDGDTLTYHMVPEIQEFTLNASSGVLKVVRPLDYDIVPREYIINLEARDENNATASATLTISLTDVNDNDPIFSEVSYSAEVIEKLVGTTYVIQVEATDADSAAFGRIRYLIKSGNDEKKFQINGSTGQITAESLDFDTTSRYSLTVTAKDTDGAADGRDTDVNVTVIVKPVCDALEEPVNGKIILSDGVTTIGSLAIQSCNLGYDLTGTSTIQCLKTRLWSAGPVNCTVKDCGKLFAPINGRINGQQCTTQSFYLSRAVYTCNDGYQLTGTFQRECESTGQWSGTDVSCQSKAACGSPPHISMAMSTINTESTSVMYECVAGYELINPAKNAMSCSDRNWMGENPACTLQDYLHRVAVTFLLTNAIDYDLLNPNINSYYRSQSQYALQSKIRQRMGIDKLFVYSNNLRKGSMVIEADVLMPSNKVALLQFLIAVQSLLRTDINVTIDGTFGIVKSITIENDVYDSDNIESNLCKLFNQLGGTCQSGYDCAVSSGLPECRCVLESESTNTTTMAVAVSLSAVITILLALLIFFVIKSRKQNNVKKDNAGNSSINCELQTRISQSSEDDYTSLDVENAGYEQPDQQTN